MLYFLVVFDLSRMSLNKLQSAIGLKKPQQNRLPQTDIIGSLNEEL